MYSLTYLCLFFTTICYCFFYSKAEETQNNGINITITQEYPWDKCTSMGQIVGTKCEEEYYECDYGDMWWVHTILCNNCIGDCPPGKVFHHPEQDECVWPETIGCGCTAPGQYVGRKCESIFYICAHSEDANGEPDWISYPVSCLDDLVYDPETHSCVSSSIIGC